jgi:hypothetical protein
MYLTVTLLLSVFISVSVPLGATGSRQTSVRRRHFRLPDEGGTLGAQASKYR